MRCSTGKQAGLFLVALSVRLVAAAVNSPIEPEAETKAPTSVSEDSAAAMLDGNAGAGAAA